MTDRPLDQWRDRMVAALYGELDDRERRELEARIEQDEELRRDWQELLEARAALQRLAAEEPVQSPGFSLPPERAARTGAKVVPMWRWLLASAAGFAAAATVFLALLLGGLRIDRTEAGLLVRFDGSPAGALAAGIDGGPRVAAGDALQPVPQYLTRAEFAAVAQALLDGTAVRIDELERRQTSSQIQLTQALYEALATTQQRQYDELSTQIQWAAMRAATSRPYGVAVPGQQPWTPLTEGNNDGTD